MIGLIACYGYVAVILVVAYAIQRYGEEVSRKFVHIMTANWWLISMLFFQKIWGPLLISLSFLVVNLVGNKYRLFRQIQVSKRDPGYGTIYYSVSMIILTLMSYGLGDLTIGLVGSLVMGYGDGFAALIGRRWPICTYRLRGNTKSIGGSLTMFGVTVMVVSGATWLANNPSNLELSLMIGIVGAILEAIATRGRDNLWVPIGCAFLYVIL
ncbi:MAG: diacylglycerol/polyprenol kinase family protein [Cellulosilyticaceae bacterium]